MSVGNTAFEEGTIYRWTSHIVHRGEPRLSAAHNKPAVNLLELLGVGWLPRMYAIVVEGWFTSSGWTTSSCAGGQFLCGCVGISVRGHERSTYCLNHEMAGCARNEVGVVLRNSPHLIIYYRVGERYDSVEPIWHFLSKLSDVMLPPDAAYSRKPVLGKW